MTTLTVRPVSEDQETAIRLFLDALHVDYNASDQSDDTKYLLSSEENKRHLQKSMDQSDNGDVISIALDDIWKP